MASRYELEVTIVSAEDLKNVNWLHGGLKPYAVVWIDPSAKSTSRVDEEGDTSPYWNQKLIIPFDSPIEDSTLYIDIVNAKPGEGAKALIGSAKLRIRDVVDGVGIGGKFDKKLELKRPSGRPHGKLEIAVSVRDSRYRSQDPYYSQSYGVPHSGSRDYPPSGYPPAGYGAPPTYAQPSYGQSGYYSQPSGGYYGQQQPPQGGYYGQQPPQGGYYGQQPPVVYEEQKKSKFGGMGMGTGLAVGAVAGALGGLALAEGFDKLEDHIADEAAERVENNYDDGDYGGGDDDY